jgi:hypothetical protein
MTRAEKSAYMGKVARHLMNLELQHQINRRRSEWLHHRETHPRASYPWTKSHEPEWP